MTTPGAIRVGTAGWAVPTPWADRFPPGPSHLARYAQVLPAAEINTSFYRDHRPATYARWAGSVPDDFRFAVKVPRRFTHDARLVVEPAEIHAWLTGPLELGDRLGPLLVQLPPSQRFEEGPARRFLTVLRVRLPGALVCEPRHATWFGDGATRLLDELRVARVAADPAPVPEGAEPGAWPEPGYWRLHGSPRMYYSPYDAAALEAAAVRLRSHAAAGHDAWCIFDNTAEFHATHDALAVQALLQAD